MKSSRDLILSCALTDGRDLAETPAPTYIDTVTALSG